MIRWGLFSFSVNAYAKNGMGVEAVESYRKIPVNLRNSVSVVCVLTACSHAGLIDEAQTIYRETSTKTKQIVTVMVNRKENRTILHIRDDLDRLF